MTQNGLKRRLASRCNFPGGREGAGLLSGIEETPGSVLIAPLYSEKLQSRETPTYGIGAYRLDRVASHQI